jgi:hypothetical protein
MGTLRLLLIGLLVISAGAIALPSSGRASQHDEWQVSSQTLVEIERMRPIGLSPDGRWLAYTDFGMRQLCVAEAETLALHLCADLEILESRLRIEDVAWSPDSTRLALAEESFVYYFDGDLWVLDVASGDLANVADDGYSGSVPLEPEGGASLAFAVAPAWFPDSTGISYSRSPWVDGDPRGNDIALISFETGHEVTLVSVSEEIPGVAYFGMAWTRDGQSLYYSVHPFRDDSIDGGIYRFDAATGVTEHILGGTEETGDPAVLEVDATGTRMLVWYPELAGRFDAVVEIYAMLDLETRTAEFIEAPSRAENPLYRVGLVGFSPDGSSYLLAERIGPEDGNLWILDVETGERSLLIGGFPGAAPMEYGMRLSWTASGRVFIPHTIGSGSMLVLTQAGTERSAVPGRRGQRSG